MPIDGIGLNKNLASFPTFTQGTRGVQPAAGVEKQHGIAEQIKGAINSVNDLQNTANELAENVATGKTGDVHTAVVAMEQALMSLDFTMQVRNKMLDAYQEIMRTQM